FEHARAQVVLFEDDVHDAIISQFLPLVPNSPTLYSYASNVDHVRARGVEATASTNDVLMKGLELSGSVTYVDAKTLAPTGRATDGRSRWRAGTAERSTRPSTRPTSTRILIRGSAPGSSPTPRPTIG